MGTYALRRVIQMIPLLLVISLLIFGLTALQPGDPVDQLVFGNSNITPEDIARLKASYGLDQPWFTRYFFWLKQAITGNFGYSQDFGIPALEYVFQNRLPNTLLLTVPALIISTLIAVPLGIFSAVRQYSALDYILTFLAFVAVSAPVFWVGALALYFFAIYLPQLTGGLLSLPPGGLGGDVPPEAGWWAVALDKLKYLLLPLMILMLREIAVTLRFMRANMLETLTQDYVRTARAKGLADRRVLYKHALRNAVTPIVTLLGLSIPGLFGGAVITETVFSWPGMGKAILDALVSKDFNVVMVCLMMLAVLTVVFQLLTDLAYALVDPRIRYA
ncbi:ABC transporter permease [Deinococcus soli (ex Cha et al. 2016)]|uniref:Peptide/nickel transport system permease protein n=2 Tax=Deinococcus soli (ex Cha et al. 2016) TaxID=1309411 RepID=A0ACC6KIK1_9DEIO|nr:ABC transporter permease [Deinococcus soli (ex Cha et al. 2016)]MDR6219349.1 peptide/nickel transport system permease protein [Deinococcus soli (ex Cha et al. 2016)]MDR6329598.1 peptide/nickel transport system permease protein [Deinococcus soli (ex Cha et al. 2016)]MDR6752258.1 peptide/nickel transport system permease protein [Deinococcus soli (ex Cha et al. 2016)]